MQTTIETELLSLQQQVEIINKRIETIRSCVRSGEYNFVSDSFQQKRIISCVCSYYDVTIDQLKSKSRKGELNVARKICFHLMKKNLPKTSLGRIGVLFGNRAHCTISTAISTVNDWIDTDEKIKNQLHEIELLLDLDQEENTINFES